MMGILSVLSRAAIGVVTGLVTAAVLAAEPAAGASPSPVAPESKPQIYLHATLIDTANRIVRPDVAVTVRGDRIEAIGAARSVGSEAGASVVDLHGKYLLPGLINTHVHLATDPDPELAHAYLRRELYSGVTAVRDMAGDVRLLAELKREAAFGEIPSPDIYYAALMAGPSFFTDPRTHQSSRGFEPGTAPWMRAVTAQTDLRQAVAEARGTGATAIKIYADLPATLVGAITAEAHRQGLLVWAHSTVFPASPMDVARAGVDVMSHADMLAYQLAGPVPPSSYAQKTPLQMRPDFDVPELGAVFDVMKERGIVLDATVDVFYAHPSTKYPAGMGAAITKVAWHNGVQISTGTDDDFDEPAEWKDPDSVLDTEIIRLVENAGLTPMEALRAATVTGARTIGQQASMGSIEAGTLADLVVLRDSPLKDIHNIRTVDFVVKHGVRFDRKSYVPFVGR